MRSEPEPSEKRITNIDIGAGLGGHAVQGVGLGRFVATITGSNPARGIYVFPYVYMSYCPLTVESLATS